MSKQVITKSFNIRNMAEGSPDQYEMQELASPLKTSVMPAVRKQVVSADIGETGVISMVDAKAEGKDEDESQDASRTTDETKAPPEKDAVAEKSDKSDAKANVLIVEDTLELAEVIQATLESMGLKSTFETHGQKAVAKFKELRPDLVLMDIGLPDMTGWKVLDSIKEIQNAAEDDKKATIIVITAYGDPANRLVGKLQGIHSYLIKPFTPDEVENLVNRALKGEPPAPEAAKPPISDDETGASS